MRRICACLVTLVLISGCSNRHDARAQQRDLERENLRLTGQVEALHEENATLREQQHEMGEENQRLRTAVIIDGPIQAADAWRELPPLGDEPRPASGVARGGNWVLVLASVGPSFAATERSNYERAAEGLNQQLGRRFGALFGLRTPTKGGLQLVYGSDRGRMGVSKDAARAPLTEIARNYADAYLLNLD